MAQPTPEQQAITDQFLTDMHTLVARYCVDTNGDTEAGYDAARVILNNV